MYIGGRKKQDLVTFGPYSLSRNPLYVFSVVGAVGIGLLSSSIAVGLIFGLATFLLFDWVIRQEERYLTEEFDTEYRSYISSTPRWVPQLGNWRDADKIVTTPPLVLKTAFDGLAFFIPWPIYELVGELQQHGFMPVLLYLP